MDNRADRGRDWIGGLAVARGLTDKQKMFVQEYLVDMNATRAAVRAGYSERNADKIGSELLGKTGVAEAIQRAVERRSKRTEISQDRVVRELAGIAFRDPRKLMSWGPDGVRLNPSDDLTAEEAAVVSEAAETTTKDGGSIKIKTVDKLGALQLLGKHLGMFTEKHDVNVSGNITVQLVDFSPDMLEQK